MTPVVSVIIVSWNVCELTVNAISSLKKSYGDFTLEIILIDNASTDGTVENVVSLFPDVRVIANKDNVGFARANNQGFQLSSGEYIFILNPDTIVKPNVIELLLQKIKLHPEVGMVGPKLIYPNGAIQYTCSRPLPNIISVITNDVLRLQSITRIFKTRFHYNKDSYTEAISGAAMFLSSDVLKKAGYFKSDYLHCGEDIDLCYQVHKAGYKILFVHDAEVIHFEGQSVAKDGVRTHVNSVLSVQKYFLYTQGPIAAAFYKSIIIFLQIPIDIIISSIKFLFARIKYQDFKSRLKLQYMLLLWKPIIKK